MGGIVFCNGNNTVFKFDLTLLTVVLTRYDKYAVGGKYCTLLKENITNGGIILEINIGGVKIFTHLIYNIVCFFAGHCRGSDQITVRIFLQSNKARRCKKCINVDIIDDMAKFITYILSAAAIHVVISVGSHLCHFVNSPLIVLNKYIRILKTVLIYLILVEEGCGHHPKKVCGNISGAEKEIVMYRTLINKCRRPPGL